MTALKLLVVFLVGSLCLGLARARADGRSRTHGFLDRIHKDAEGKEARYVLFVPHSYRSDKPYPLILFLHGAGETGTDGQKQAVVGLGKAIRARAKSFPFLALFPQAHKRTWQANSAEAQRALGILQEIQEAYRVDAKRLYLTGLSMGGFGTWSLAAKYPDRWAAIVPICGGGNPKVAAAIKHIPCWCFHGDADKTVPVERSRQMITALEEAGGSPKYEEYAGVGHNSWDKAYGTPELYGWLLQQRIK